jgi:hypothetical protein
MKNGFVESLNGRDECLNEHRIDPVSAGSALTPATSMCKAP